MSDREMKLKQAENLKEDLERIRTALDELGAETAASHVDDAIDFLQEFVDYELTIPAKVIVDSGDHRPVCTAESAGFCCCLRLGHRGDHEAWCTEPVEMIKKWARKRRAA